jgi:hypothetical protein
MPLPPWLPDHPRKDNWQTVAKLRAQTENANSSPADSTAQAGEAASAITSFVDRHHDF